MPPLTPLDAQTRALLDQINSQGGPTLAEMTIAETRAALRHMSESLAGPKTAVGAVEDREIPGPGGTLPIRIYRPADATGTLPCAVYFHGGGYHFGDLESHDPIRRFLCAAAGIIVIGVAYRLAPEHKFPAGLEDCYAALQWTTDQAGAIGVDPDRIAVVGDSAGATLAVSTCMLARERGGPPVRYQVVIGALLDLGDGRQFPSREALGGGEYFVSEAVIDHIREAYLSEPETEWRDPLASPIRATDFSGLPPALVVTAEYDPSRDENEEYAKRLEAAGVPAEYQCFEGTIHGFYLFDGVLEVGRRGRQFIADKLRAALRG